MIRMVKAEELERFMTEALVKIGVSVADAMRCSEVLGAADRLGIDTHGIGRFKPIYYDRIRKGILLPVTRIERVRETQTTAVLDGQDGMGHVIAYEGMWLAMEKAAESGMGMVACRRSSHFGIAGYYARMAAERGMIGVVGTNARPSIAPTFGVENMLGTNPLTIGIPTDEAFPFILDGATSVSQRGKIEKLQRENKPTPAGWVIGRDGEPRTDTGQILKDLVTGAAALTPLGGIGESGGGHKGYGYATVVEILSAALADGPFLKDLSDHDAAGHPRPYHLGHFFIAIDVGHFIDPGRFREIAGAILRQLRASEKMPGADRIYTAWEKEYETSIIRAKTGIPIIPTLWAQIETVAEEQGMALPPWEPGSEA